ncbi:hypothetical protein UFOVP326_2 [uncultured Caudovirales phage]|uniref:Uncharacterized protein n=1 Tax=uncultured Caudovirales phage TaxID=2100421 RepID=A0A6J5LRX2_9CAUD|nr:hypothetical protein UFOVP326_2 [uncultured Caudovirales phage]
MQHLVDHLGRPAGRFYCKIFRRGVLLDVVDEPNLVVDLAKQHHAILLGSADANRRVSRFGVGTNGTAPAAGNTGLTGAITKTVDAVTYPVAGSVAFSFSLLTGEANGMAIMEFGLFTASGVLYARKTRLSPLAKESDISLSGTWTIAF